MNFPEIFVIFDRHCDWIDAHPNLPIEYIRFLEDEKSIDKIIEDISNSGIKVHKIPFKNKNYLNILDEIINTKNAMLWNLTDGYEYFTGSNFPAVLQLANIPYIGSGSYTQMLCQNKNHLKAVANSLGINVPKGGVIEENSFLSKQIHFWDNIDPPYFIKPVYLDNGIGDNIAYPICNNKSELILSIKKLFKHNIQKISVEEFLPGKEYSVIAVNSSNWIYECGEISYEGNLYLSSKLKDKRKYKCNFIHDSLSNKIIDKTKQLATEIKLKDYFRADYRLDEKGNIFLLEVNSNPFIMSLTFNNFINIHFKNRSDLLTKIIIQSFKRQSS